LDGVLKGTGNDIEPTGSIFFPLKLYNDLDAFFNCFLLKPIFSKVERNNIFAWLPLLTNTLITFHLSMCVMITIVSVWDRCELRSASVKVYLDVRPLGSHDWTLDRYMINLAVVLLLLSLIFEGRVGASGDGVYGSEGWKT
jgi:hypothetical protein